MYEYRFVKIELSNWSSQPKEDYQEIIKQHASKGWRFVQIFDPAIKG